MSVTDPISDMFSSIKNAQKINKDVVQFPFSKIKQEILQIFVKEGYISSFDSVDQDNNKKFLKVNLKYTKEGTPAIDSLKRISKPSKRVYLAKKEIYKVLNGFGTLILSTPNGIVTGKDARKSNMGGEVICEVY